MSNTRPVSILRYNAENMRNNGAPQDVIAKYLADNGSSFQQIMSVPVPTQDVLDRALASEKDGSFAERRNIIEESQKRNTENYEKIAKNEVRLGKARALGSGLLYDFADEAESAMTGQPLAEIKAERQKFAQEHPVANVAYGFAGALANPVRIPFANPAVTTLGKMGQSAAQAGLYGTLYGLGSGDGIEDRVKQALKQGAMSAAIGGAATGAWELGKKALSGPVVDAVGKASGVGGETLRRGYDAGKRGSKIYLDTMRKNADVYDVVGDVDKVIRQMERERGAAFNATLPKDKSFKISKDSVVEALKKAQGEISGVTEGVDDAALKAVQKAQKLMENVDKNGGLTFQNALDMKKGLDSIIGPLSRAGEDNAVRILKPVQNELVRTMTDKVPEYATARQNFQKASDVIGAIKDAFQSKNKTAELRNLQSITRDSVAAAQGGKLQLGKILDAASDKRILDAVAGNQAQQWWPRDILRNAIGVGGIAGSKLLGSSVFTPTAALTIPAMSPRLSGEIAYGLGWLANKGGNMANKFNVDAGVAQLYQALRNIR